MAQVKVIRLGYWKKRRRIGEIFNLPDHIIAEDAKKKKRNSLPWYKVVGDSPVIQEEGPVEEAPEVDDAEDIEESGAEKETRPLSNDPGLTVADVCEQLESMSDVDEINDYVNEDTRVGVKAAAEQRIAVLTEGA